MLWALGAGCGHHRQQLTHQHAHKAICTYECLEHVPTLRRTFFVLQLVAVRSEWFCMRSARCLAALFCLA